MNNARQVDRLVEKQRHLSDLPPVFSGQQQRRHRRSQRDPLPSDYIQKLGADTIWLNPIYVSPLIDNGYDIADYRAIHPQYGTMEDFEQLLREAHEKGFASLWIWSLITHPISTNGLSSPALPETILIPISTSGKTRKKTARFPTTGARRLADRLWTYVPERDQYYLHCFAKEQPDLNWENPAVREAVYEDMRFWLDKGVDGFRMDVISVISKDPPFRTMTAASLYKVLLHGQFQRTARS